MRTTRESQEEEKSFPFNHLTWTTTTKAGLATSACHYHAHLRPNVPHRSKLSKGNQKSHTFLRRPGHPLQHMGRKCPHPLYPLSRLCLWDRVAMHIQLIPNPPPQQAALWYLDNIILVPRLVEDTTWRHFACLSVSQFLDLVCSPRKCFEMLCNSPPLANTRHRFTI